MTKVLNCGNNTFIVVVKTLTIILKLSREGEGGGKLLRSILVTLLITGLILSFGCSGSPVAPQETKDMEAFFSGVSPKLTGVVGEYTFKGNDGTVETGKIVADENGLTLVPDRGVSAYSNLWFDVDCAYLNPRYYSQAGLPVYFIGDCIQYRLTIDYKRGLPLNLYPILYSKVTAEQRYWPTLNPLPGAWQEIWNPVEIAPYGQLILNDTYCIPPSTIPGNDATVIKIDLQFWFGMWEFTLAHGICGLWDP